MYKSLLVLFSSNMIYVTCVCIILLALLMSEKSAKNFLKKVCATIDFRREILSTTTKKVAPGPTPYPVIGNLACLDGYEVPYQAFSALRKKYGDIITLKLGNVPAVVVNGIDNIKEVLVSKGAHFDGRPNFRRYHQLFSGNKENCKYLSQSFSDVRKISLSLFESNRHFSLFLQHWRSVIGLKCRKCVVKCSYRTLSHATFPPSTPN